MFREHVEERPYFHAAEDHAAAVLVGLHAIIHTGGIEDSFQTEGFGQLFGNVDQDGPCGELPETEVLLLEGRYIYMVHDLNTLHLDPAAGKFAAVLSGHTHVPNFYKKKGVLYFNPGPCGPRRFELPVTVGLLTIGKDCAAHLKEPFRSADHGDRRPPAGSRAKPSIA